MLCNTNQAKKPTFRFSFSFPNLSSREIREGSIKFTIISRSNWILSIGCPNPSNLIIMIREGVEANTMAKVTYSFNREGVEMVSMFLI
jgi:hypothetical protein